MNSFKKLLFIAALGLAAVTAVPIQHAAAEDIVVRTGPSHHERREAARERAREREIARERERRIERHEARRDAREHYHRHHHHEVVVVP
jgi:hypothetical protein